MQNINDIVLACGTRLVDANMEDLIYVRGYEVRQVDGVRIVLGTSKGGSWVEPAGVKFSVSGSTHADADCVYANKLMGYTRAAKSARQMADSLEQKAAEYLGSDAKGGK